MQQTQTTDQYLPTADGHTLHYACFGEPLNRPILFLHGGPGSACNPADAHLFRLEHYRLIQTDQRGCGKSTPAGSIRDNHTAALLADLEQLRHHLGIPRWLVYGGSWGAALALEYAKHYRPSVEGLILRGTFLARPQDLDWFFHPNGVAQQRPTAYADLCAALHLAPSQASTTALIDQLYTQLQQAAQNPVQAYQAALAIGSWNSVVMGMSALQPETDPTARQRRIGRELIFAHYCHHRFFLGDTGVLTGLETLADLPITLIHGNQDQVCPLAGAETLSRLLPHARLITVEAGHPLQAGAIREALRRVLDEWLHQATGSAPLSTTIHGDAGRVHEAQTIFF